MHQYAAFLMPCHPDTERNEICVRRLVSATPNTTATMTTNTHLTREMYKSNEAIYFNSAGNFLVVKSRYRLPQFSGVFPKSDVTILLNLAQTGATMEV